MERVIRAPRGVKLNCKGWPQEAALRMLMNNLDNEGVCIAVDVDQTRIDRRLGTGYCDRQAATLSEALALTAKARQAAAEGAEYRSGLRDRPPCRRRL